MKHSQFIIAGGGIGGLTMALALQQNDSDYLLYEKADKISYHEVGLGISRNIFPILQKWNILDEVLNTGAEIETIRFVDKQVREIRSYRL